jgi:hypothetical protein
MFFHSSNIGKGPVGGATNNKRSASLLRKSIGDIDQADVPNSRVVNSQAAINAQAAINDVVRRNTNMRVANMQGQAVQGQVCGFYAPSWHELI